MTTIPSTAKVSVSVTPHHKPQASVITPILEMRNMISDEVFGPKAQKPVKRQS